MLRSSSTWTESDRISSVVAVIRTQGTCRGTRGMGGRGGHRGCRLCPGGEVASTGHLVQVDLVRTKVVPDKVHKIVPVHGDECLLVVQVYIGNKIKCRNRYTSRTRENTCQFMQFSARMRTAGHWALSKRPSSVSPTCLPLSAPSRWANCCFPAVLSWRSTSPSASAAARCIRACVSVQANVSYYYT